MTEVERILNQLNRAKGGVQLEVRAALWRPSISVVSEPRAVATGSYAQLSKSLFHKLLCDPVATARGSDTYS